ncbi:mechanosensitive ion channel [Mesorhizobium sp. BR1-1-16]|uniref:mechanosensitive ion channel domain-containing protein n=1 Tax=Mesorhizobium sp. BR1-1-16 TaxID=2876653 RepID=UPI001CCD1E8F|nr:mechanosensitive ion channel domain-containing protein [Mesorhizobium sp. BR1-1-16]MBZ9934848.1 mechanosensitive ion channel [Mesorhizobium sp. BR1-1-16]
MDSAIGERATNHGSRAPERQACARTAWPGHALLLVVVALIALAGGCGGARAQLNLQSAPSTTSTQSTKADPQAEVKAVSEALARVLADPTARDLFLKQLQNAATPAAAQPDESSKSAASSLIPVDIAADVDALTASIGQDVSDIAQRTLAGLLNLRAIFDGSVSVEWSSLLDRTQITAAMIVIAVVLTTLLRAMAQWLLAYLDQRAAHRRRWQRLLIGAVAALVDFVPTVIALFAMIGVGLKMTGSTRLGFVETQFAAAYVASEIARQVLRIIFRRRYRHLRLLPCPDGFAQYWSGRASALVSFVGYGLLFVGPTVSYVIAFRLGIGVRMAIVVAATLTAIILILRNRHSVRDQLVEASNTVKSRALAQILIRMSGIWHVLLIAYLLTGFVVWSTRPADALRFMLWATLWSMVSIIVGALVMRFTRQAGSSGVRLPDSLKTSLPMLERRVNLFVPTMVAAVRIATAVVVFFAVLNAWALVDLSGWVTDAGNAGMIRRLGAALIVLLLMIAGWLAATSWIEYQLHPHSGRDMRARTRTLFSLLSNALTIVFAAIGLMLVLSELGVDIAPLIAGAGVVGLAVGFGSQKLVQDIITGAFIQLENAMNEGEVVTAGGISGVVERLTIRSVGLRDLSGVYHVIPFSSVDSVSNFMRGFAFHVEELGVAYREDVGEVKQLMFDAFDRLQETPHKAHILAPLDMQGVISLGDNAVTIRARIKTSPGQQWSVGRAYTELLKTVLDEHGVDIPFPQRTLWFGQPKSGEAPPLTFTGRVREARPAATRRSGQAEREDGAADLTPAQTLDVPRSPEHEEN